MKKLFAVILMVCMCAGIFAGCGSKGKEQNGNTEVKESAEVVYICRSMSDPFASWLANSFKETGEKEEGFSVKIMDCEDDASKNVQMLENAINTSPDAIVLHATADARVLSYIQEAQDKGIAVVFVNLPLPEDPEAVATVLCDDYTLGYTLAQKAAELIPENGNVVILNGIAGMTVTTERRRGFQEGLFDVREDLTLLDEQTGDFDKNSAMNIMEDWLQKYDQIDAVVSANDGMVLGAIEAYKSSGTDYSNVQFFGIDGLADACLSIQAGEETASVLQDAQLMADEAIKMVKGIMDGSITDHPTISIEAKVIDAENVEEQIEQHKTNGLIE